ncbi:hypothetical protein N7466_010026 [Penicillium verhagenii]|uniref:uncharacterized protein n=1 Tax=Penicillium verhagenii TaxID=1562060 RepID=UPI0025455B51|nr:uncharacterized protein N7466_010026 [Penicillium verhagenii]KAJ5919083.1 hypothetical protein N7466_010026 [Penicillium verhagenii]
MESRVIDLDPYEGWSSTSSTAEHALPRVSLPMAIPRPNNGISSELAVIKQEQREAGSAMWSPSGFLTVSSSRSSKSPQSPQSSQSSCPMDETTPGSSQEKPIDLTAIGPLIIDLTDEVQANTRMVAAFADTAQVSEIRQQTSRLTLGPQVHESISSSPAVVNGVVYGPGSSVELHDGTFLYIEHVEQRGGEYFFHGRHLVLSTSGGIGDYFPKIEGEAIWLYHNTDLCAFDQIKCFRRIRFSNLRRDKDPEVIWPSEGQRGDDLACRLKFTLKFRPILPHHNSRIRAGLEDQEFAVEYLTFDEATVQSKYRRTAKELRDEWRGFNQTIPFGSAVLAGRSGPLVIDLANPVARSWNVCDSDPRRTYTFGDAYCGAGGTSCGAQKAGLALTWAVDMDTNACQTYRQNFPQSLVENSSIDQFLTQDPSELRVDIIHTSPPCQPFSPAHTVHNQTRDERNSACIFTSLNLIEKARPRVITMEETFGLRGRHPAIFNRLIMDFIEMGYSVRWTVVDCINYGVPQIRRRLIIIASGPGETLPNIASPTHGPFGTGLEPFETIHGAISGIPSGSNDHNVSALLERSKNSFREAFSPHQPAKTITCSGGEANYHPSGKRAYTPREVACLQTFPLEFQLCGRSIRRQIGNAVPPRLAEAIFREIHKSLQRTDAQM